MVVGLSTIAMMLCLMPAGSAGAVAGSEPKMPISGPRTPADSSSPDAVGELAINDIPFARAGGVRLMWPAKHVVAFAFHESLAKEAFRQKPRGRPGRIDHSRFVPPRQTRGPKYLVMASRARGTHPASAVDIPLSRREPVLAPVTGRVISVTKYRLYCKSEDIRVILRPVGSRRNVVIFHLDKLRVSKGDSVVAGQSRLGKARVFPNSSAQYDSYIGGDHPHVHIEVGRRGFAPVPGCSPRPLRGR